MSIAVMFRRSPGTSFESCSDFPLVEFVVVVKSSLAVVQLERAESREERTLFCNNLLATLVVAILSCT